jgi:hypothetical protein
LLGGIEHGGDADRWHRNVGVAIVGVRVLVLPRSTAQPFPLLRGDRGRGVALLADVGPHRRSEFVRRPLCSGNCPFVRKSAPVARLQAFRLLFTGAQF